MDVLHWNNVHKVMPATHAPELVAVVWHQKLARVSVNLVQVLSGTSFLHAIEQSSILAQKLSGTWHEPCDVIGRRVVLCKKLWWTCVKLFVQVSGKFLSYQFLVHMSPALRTKQNVLLLLLQLVIVCVTSVTKCRNTPHHHPEACLLL